MRFSGRFYVDLKPEAFTDIELGWKDLAPG